MSSIRTGMFWVALCRYSTRIVLLLATLVLARLLTPKEFGLMAGAMIAIDLLALFQDFGISKELIYRRDRLEDATHTAFTIILSLGTLLFLVALALSPVLSVVLKLPGLTGIVIVASSSLVFSSFGTVPAALMQRRQEFKLLVLPTFVAAVVGPATAIVAAMMGFGAYSLAVREVVAAIVESALLLWLSGYRPKFLWDRPLAREILNYAKPLLGANMMAAGARQIPSSILARLFGPAILGGYSLANRLATLPTQEISSILNRVLLPHFSARRHEPREVRDLLLKTTKLLAVLGVPLSLAVSWFAPLALHLLYGPKWDHAITFFRILPIYALLGALASPYGEACKGVGRTGLVLGYYLVQVITLALAIPIGVALGGAVGFAWAMVLAALSSLVWLMHRTMAHLKGSPLEFIKPWRSTIVASCVTYAGVLLLGLLAPLSNVIVKNCVEGFIGLCLFGACILLWDQEFFEMIRPRPIVRQSA